MPHATAADGTRLYYEEAGEGTPVIFAHGFGGDWRSWEPQLRQLARSHRCVTFSARGHPPSDIPQESARYSQDIAWQDLIAVADHLKLKRAHLVGHSMGSWAVLYAGLNQPERCFSLALSGCGFFTPPPGQTTEEFLAQRARGLAAQGVTPATDLVANSPGQQPFKRKDPRGHAELLARRGERSPIGMSLTLENVQAKRPNLQALQTELQKIRLPVLLMVGDEDKNALDCGVFLKRAIPRAGLRVMPDSGHPLPVEEPAAFNGALLNFWALVEGGRWMTHYPG